jgi:hypothetical protein
MNGHQSPILDGHFFMFSAYDLSLSIEPLAKVLT